MMATFILADLVAPVSSARWVLNEYVGEMRDGKLVELTQPAKISVDAYWDQVNG